MSRFERIYQKVGGSRVSVPAPMMAIRRSLTSDGGEASTWRSRSLAKHAGEARSTPLDSAMVGEQNWLGETGVKLLREMKYMGDVEKKSTG